MDDDTQKITYNYQSPRFSPRAVEHAFRYIKALTGLEFAEDEESTAIIRRDDIPGGNGGLCIRDKNDDSASVVLRDDPIDVILKAVTISSRLGPYKKMGDSPGEPIVPKISEVISALSMALAKANLIPSGRRHISIWPDGKRFGAAITHDVDIAERSLAGGVRLLFKRWPAGRFKGLADTIRWRSGRGTNPYDRITEWLDLEEKSELVSTFFVFAGPRNHPDDPKYNLKRISVQLKSAVNRGFEIALHSGIESFDGRYVNESKNILEKNIGTGVRGIRPHYLSAHLPEYWRMATDTGLSYSSSLGFDDRIGYYAGIDLPVIPYDSENDCPLNVVEIPITIMDCGLIGDQAVDSAELKSKAFRIIDQAEERGSLIVFDWHQRTLYDPDYPGWGRLFFEIIEYLIQKNPYIDTMSGIADLLNARMGMKS
ncbi:MAG: hypothetical protein V3W18_05035 [candidate division Zixibacteria bacterium]